MKATTRKQSQDASPETQPSPAWIAFFEEALRLADLARTRRRENGKARAGEAQATTRTTNNGNSNTT